jgi:hypothetical protein
MAKNKKKINLFCKWFFFFEKKKQKIKMSVLRIGTLHHWHRDHYLQITLDSDCEKIIEIRMWDGTMLNWNTPHGLLILFMFFGTSPGDILLSGGDCTLAKLYQMVYALEFEKPIRFVGIWTCGCNMGHCSAILGIGNVDTANTIGDAFRLFGDEETYKLPSIEKPFSLDFFSYPDSVFLSLAGIDNLPTKAHRNGSCREPLVPLMETFPIDETQYNYMTFSYGR